MLSLKNSIVSQNKSGIYTVMSGDYAKGGGKGGGIYAAARSVTLENSFVNDNSTGNDSDFGSGDGGGIYIIGEDSSLMLKNSIIDANTVGGGPSSGLGSDGGGIYVHSGTLAIESSTVSNNAAGSGYAGSMGSSGPGGNGGGIYIESGTATLRNSTVSMNAGGDGGYSSSAIGGNGGSGGGIYVGANATFVLENATVSNNRTGSGAIGVSGNGNSGWGGGIHIGPAGATIKMRNTILSGNTVKSGGWGPDCSGIFVSNDYNIIGNPSDCNFLIMPNDQVTDPLLDILSENGGSSKTHALKISSPAIDTGSCIDIDGSPIITDQRGLRRPQPAGGSCDIGAYEFEQIPPNPPTGLDLSPDDDTGTSDSDNLTSTSSALTITGSGEDGATAQLYNDTSPIGATATVSQGLFSIDISLSGRTESYNITAKLTDVFGNVSEASASLQITVDTFPPFGSIEILDNEGHTNDDTPELRISSTGDAQMRFALTEAGLETSGWIDYATSHASFNIAPDGEEGEKWVLAQFRDAAGNESATETDSTTYDKTPPNPPESAEEYRITNQTSPTEWEWRSGGGGGSGDFRHRLDDAELSGETTKTTHTHNEELSEGEHTLYVQERDEAGNWSESAEFVVLVDTTASGTLQVSGATPTNDTTPTWAWAGGEGGTGTFRHLLGISGEMGEDTIEKMETEATETGETSLTPKSPLSPEGFHTLFVQEQDQAENWSAIDLETPGAGWSEIEIDSGKPCSHIRTGEWPAAVNDATRNITVAYEAYDAYAGETCGAASSGSGIEKVELYVKGPNDETFPAEPTATDSGSGIDGAFTFETLTEGLYRFRTIATDRAGNTEDAPDGEYDTETIYTSKFSGYAILAVGWTGKREGLDAHTLAANNIYRHLVRRKFALVGEDQEPLGDPLDHIRYFNPSEENITGVDDKFSKGGILTLKNAVTVWAPEKMRKLPGPLYLILINHGGKGGQFYLSGGTEIVSPSDIGEWLDTLEAGMASEGIARQDIVVILGFCYSGAFVSELSKPGRIIVSSSGPDEFSYRGPYNPHRGTPIRDGEFFTSSLFGELAAGNDLRTAFENATEMAEGLTDRRGKIDPDHNDTAKQHPLMDDSGDGVGHNDLSAGDSTDGKVAREIFLGHGTDAPVPFAVTKAGADVRNPETGDWDPSPEPVLEAAADTALLWAETDDPGDSGRNTVWAEVREPGDLPESGGAQPAVELESVPLEWDPGKNRHEAEYAGFSESGAYDLFFYAENAEGVITAFGKLRLSKRKAENTEPGLAEAITGLRILCGETPAVLSGADADGDGRITFEDVVSILRDIAGL